MSANQKFPIPENDGAANHIEKSSIPSISLPNQEGNLLRLDRSDTFRMILYFFPMTGRPDMPLPENWNSIPGASGCTLETCKFRDKYDDLIGLNAVPIGVTSQTVEYNKEMTNRLGIPFDVLSDAKLELKDSLSLPTFSIDNKKQQQNLIETLKQNCRRIVREKTGKKPYTSINIARI